MIADGTPPETPPTRDHQEQFLREHYGLIADHATQLSGSRWRYVQLSLFGVAVFYSHLFTTGGAHYPSGALKVLMGLPVALAIFGGVQAWAIRYGIQERNKVLLRIEQHYEFEGWAHNVDRRWNTVGQNPFDYLVYTYWGSLTVFTLLLAGAVWLGCIEITG